jgi:hypothetical protein
MILSTTGEDVERNKNFSILILKEICKKVSAIIAAYD